MHQELGLVDLNPQPPASLVCIMAFLLEYRVGGLARGLDHAVGLLMRGFVHFRLVGASGWQLIE